MPQTNLFRSTLQTFYPTLEVNWAMLLSYFPTYKFNITDSLIGSFEGNSFPGVDLPTECHAAIALYFDSEKPAVGITMPVRRFP